MKFCFVLALLKEIFSLMSGRDFPSIPLDAPLSTVQSALLGGPGAARWQRGVGEIGVSTGDKKHPPRACAPTLVTSPPPTVTSRQAYPPVLLVLMAPNVV